MRSLKIGEVARLAGVAVDTVRYYHRLELLPTVTRLASGYRAFEPPAIERIMLIKELQGLGLHLDEIQSMIQAMEHGGSCASESVRLERALAQADGRLASSSAV